MRVVGPPPQPPTLLQLESLTLSHLDIEDCDLLYALERRDSRLQKLVIESCIVSSAETQTKLMELVGKVELSNLRVLELDCDGTDDEQDTDEGSEE